VTAPGRPSRLQPPYDGAQPVLCGPRVVLRPARLDDADLVLAACQDPDMQRWTTIPTPYTAADARTFVAVIAPAAWAQGRGATWVLCRAGEDDYAGAIDLLPVPGDPGRAEVGFACAPWARGEGLVTAALRLVSRWGFAELGLARIEWRAYVGNSASRRVAEKAGFRYEGEQRSRLEQRGVRRDAWVASLLPGDLR
jgi:RimJ/RimL family protein N-acetyltransferase